MVISTGAISSSIILVSLTFVVKDVVFVTNISVLFGDDFSLGA
jgi:pilus assembly protein TadC